ncbi:MAG: 2-C-methyl-D-erythritol 2,4-cyclodiphosphate synthase [Puniceicoccales bacterium]|jgi:2-C-methyl-D-erythritol 2,4-cyclodiphosphate synthase|nr:2-C-methyl-D-erythritol 2,4-cyclodiphosphate synthase [Puniceicoccales bacterium]
MELRIGHGYDIHRFVKGRKLILGGIEIPFKCGLLGHSDADCLCHAITDALLGALALPNIGQFYPDTDKKTIGITSTEILQNIYKNEILQRNYKIINIDCTIIAQEPKLAPHLNLMCQNLTKLLQLSGGQVGIKATTHEGLDAIGEKKAIACHSVCLLENLGLCPTPRKESETP